MLSLRNPGVLLINIAAIGANLCVFQHSLCLRQRLRKLIDRSHTCPVAHLAYRLDSSIVSHILQRTVAQALSLNSVFDHKPVVPGFLAV